MFNTRMRVSALAAALLWAIAGASPVAAQITTAAVRGTVTSAGAPVEGARVEAVHEPSGTRYTTGTRADGRFTITGMRVGGPYRITAQRIGITPQTRTGITLSLGVASEIVTTAFALLFGAVALALALSFGLGNRELAAEITREWYNRYKAERDAIERDHAQLDLEDEAEAAGYRGPSH